MPFAEITGIKKDSRFQSLNYSAPKAFRDAVREVVPGGVVVFAPHPDIPGLAAVVSAAGRLSMAFSLNASLQQRRSLQASLLARGYSPAEAQQLSPSIAPHPSAVKDIGGHRFVLDDLFDLSSTACEVLWGPYLHGVTVVIVAIGRGVLGLHFAACDDGPDLIFTRGAAGWCEDPFVTIGCPDIPLEMPLMDSPAPTIHRAAGLDTHLAKSGIGCELRRVRSGAISPYNNDLLLFITDNHGANAALLFRRGGSVASSISNQWIFSKMFPAILPPLPDTLPRSRTHASVAQDSRPPSAMPDFPPITGVSPVAPPSSVGTAAPSARSAATASQRHGGSARTSTRTKTREQLGNKARFRGPKVTCSAWHPLLRVRYNGSGHAVEMKGDEELNIGKPQQTPRERTPIHASDDQTDESDEVSTGGSTNGDTPESSSTPKGTLQQGHPKPEASATSVLELRCHEAPVPLETSLSIVAMGGSDGTVRIADVRAARNTIACLLVVDVSALDPHRLSEGRSAVHALSWGPCRGNNSILAVHTSTHLVMLSVRIHCAAVLILGEGKGQKRTRRFENPSVWVEVTGFHSMRFIATERVAPGAEYFIPRFSTGCSGPEEAAQADPPDQGPSQSLPSLLVESQTTDMSGAEGGPGASLLSDTPWQSTIGSGHIYPQILADPDEGKRCATCGGLLHDLTVPLAFGVVPAAVHWMPAVAGVSLRLEGLNRRSQCVQRYAINVSPNPASQGSLTIQPPAVRFLQKYLSVIQSQTDMRLTIKINEDKVMLPQMQKTHAISKDEFKALTAEMAADNPSGEKLFSLVIQAVAKGRDSQEPSERDNASRAAPGSSTHNRARSLNGSLSSSSSVGGDLCSFVRLSVDPDDFSQGLAHFFSIENDSKPAPISTICSSEMPLAVEIAALSMNLYRSAAMQTLIPLEAAASTNATKEKAPQLMARCRCREDVLST